MEGEVCRGRGMNTWGGRMDQLMKKTGLRLEMAVIRGETEVLRVVPRGWGCRRGRLVESDSVIYFSSFGYVRPVLTRTAPIDLGPFLGSTGITDIKR